MHTAIGGILPCEEILLALCKSGTPVAKFTPSGKLCTFVDFIFAIGEYPSSARRHPMVCFFFSWLRYLRREEQNAETQPQAERLAEMTPEQHTLFPLLSNLQT